MVGRSLNEEVLMYRGILVPLDGTPFGEAALPHAISIARHASAPLHLAHVHLPPMVPSGAEAAALPLIWVETARTEKRHYLGSLAREVAERWEIPVQAHVVDGGITAGLANQVDECQADLIVMSTHGHVGLRRLWHHGVAEQLTRELSIPAVLVRAEIDTLPASRQLEAPCEIGNVMVLLDGSQRSEGILEHVALLASVCGAHLTLAGLHGDGADEGGAGPESPRTRMTTAELHRYLERAAERLAARRLSVSTVLMAEDQPAEAVAEYIGARAGNPQRRVDLVAMEVTDRHLMKRLLSRDLGDALLERCPVPILRTRSGARLVAEGVAAGARSDGR